MKQFPSSRNLLFSQILFVCAMLIAFSVSSTASAQENRSCGKRGGVLRTHAGEDLVSFDFHKQTTVRTQQRVGGSYNRLFRYSFYEKGKIVPDLVESYEVAKDGLTYTFKLRSGVKFHCGKLVKGRPGACTSLDSSDVVWSLDKIRNKKFSRRAGYFSAVKKIEAVDTLTVRMQLSQPDAGLISKLAVGWAAIFPSEVPWDKLGEVVVGTGPFIFKEYVTGAGSTTVRNPNYFRKGYPCLDGIRNFVFKDPTVALANLRAKKLEINSYMQYIYPADAKLLKQKHPKIKVSLPSRLWWHAIAGKAGLISKLAVGWAAIFPSEVPWDKLGEVVVGTGPFIFKEYVTGAGSTTVRNPNYFRKGYPCLDGIRNFVFKDPTVALANLRAKKLEINSYMQYIYPADAKLLKQKHPKIKVSLPSRLWWHAIAGKVDKAPWSDKRVRQAFHLAIDRYKAVEVLGEGVGSVGSYMPPWTKWSLPKTELGKLVGTASAKNVEARRNKAKKLLADAGYKPGSLKLKWLTLDTPESILTPQFVQEQLRLIGVTIELEVSDRGTFTKRRDSGDYQLISVSNVAGTLDPSLFYADFFVCKASSNESGYCNQKFDALFKQQLSEQSEKERVKIIHKMERILQTDLPAIQVRWVAEGMAWQPWVKNWEDVDPAYYNNVTLEEVWLDDPSKY